jgi:hypothetical protein
MHMMVSTQCLNSISFRHKKSDLQGSLRIVARVDSTYQSKEAHKALKVYVIELLCVTTRANVNITPDSPDTDQTNRCCIYPLK